MTLLSRLVAGCITIVVCTVALAAEPQIELFAPQGTVKKVRQVTVRFSEAMVPFGDPRLTEPFDIDCPMPGTARWADSRNWVYDFERDLPAGLRCRFRLKPDVRTLAGARPGGAAEYQFNTGGPAIRQSMPYEGARIDEEQVFLLGLDAPAEADSILAHAYCEVQGIKERIAVKLVPPAQRRELLAAQRSFVDRFLHAWLVSTRTGESRPITLRDFIKGSDYEKFLNAKPEDSPIVALACQRRLPNNAQVRLIWGKGIKSASGIATEAERALAFQVREEFRAQFHCERVNANADCIPILPLTLSFNAPVPRAQAREIRLKTPDGKLLRPTLGNDDDDQAAATVTTAVFPGPFAERASYVLQLPKGMVDDGGRALDNHELFPLTIRTDDDPPLAKFPARFGIIEHHADPTLPVTLRNLEAQLDTSLLKVAGPEGTSLMDKVKQSWGAIFSGDKGKQEPVTGTVVRLWQDAVPQILLALKQLNEWRGREGERSLFESTGLREPQRFALPKPLGERAFEVVGIPLKEPGFYVVELASPKLGAALHGDAKPYYVQTAALVTNLAVHFKHGRESSAVWVTALDNAKPVKGAKVEVRDCANHVHAAGITGDDGLLRLTQTLPNKDTLPDCLHGYDKEFFITARTDDDFAFAFSNWSEGIDPWRFQLPTERRTDATLASSVFDRSLFRAGETVHMKHFYRRHTGGGFADGIEARAAVHDSRDEGGRAKQEARAEGCTGCGFDFVDKALLPNTLVVEHLGSDQRYEQPLTWDEQGIAETTWAIPADARLGTYQVRFVQAREGAVKDVARRARHGRLAPEQVGGSFRVEAFRVPTIKAVVKPLASPLINARSAQLDVQLSYLAGGGAGGTTVKVRGLVQPKELTFPDYEGFQFANGDVKEGRERPGASRWSYRDYVPEDADEETAAEPGTNAAPGARVLATQLLTLDAAGGARVTLDKLPTVAQPHVLQAEMEYADANGEILTASARVPLLPARVVVGLKPDAWAASKDKLKFHALVLDPEGKPRAGVPVTLDLLQRKTYSHRKRLVGGFYAYEHYREVKPLKPACRGVSDAKGLLVCEVASPVAGNVIVRARASDEAGNVTAAHRDVWVAGKDEWWFDVANDDRMDLLPERKRYEPGETATLQVRMPFREATALVTVEREGVIESFVTQLSGTAPVVKVPIRGYYAPNVFVSVLAVRGRVAGVQPTALVDLGKPAFKLGMAEIQVGWRAHELKVEVSPERATYQVRDKARVKIKVRRADSGASFGYGEIALAAVDEGLLELMNNDSWKLLDAMMQRRGIEVRTATAQMHVVGKRHYGRKNLPPGGGGGRQVSRELFDTLLLWKARVKLNALGEATVEVPLNDSLTSFRLVAIANGQSGFFGTGEARIRSTQDLMLLAGQPPLVREQDRYVAGLTVRNSAQRPLSVTVQASVRATESLPGTRVELPALTAQTLTLAPGAASTVHWETQVPVNARRLEWQFQAEAGAARDRLKISQGVIPAVRVRTFQATLTQLDPNLNLPVAIPNDAIPGRGGVKLGLRARLADELAGVKEYMSGYPYTCLEQLVSTAIALRSETRWKFVMNALPSYLDSDGLAKYFPILSQGSDALTSYVLTIADEAGWEIPRDARERMLKGLSDFVQGRIVRRSALPTADLTLRKLSALNALARHQAGVNAMLLGSITIDPNLWPTSAVLDWLDVLKRSAGLPQREPRRAEAEQILRARLNFQGTTLGFSTERSDALWWLMCSVDANANRMLLAVLDNRAWREDVPRLVRGALGRQHRGHWNTTVANAWGVLAMEKFSQAFESVPVSGSTRAALGAGRMEHAWDKSTAGSETTLDWPKGQQTLKVEHHGAGKPWLTVQSLAAIPLKEPFSTGYRITRRVTPVEQKVAGAWSRGDVYRVRLEVEAQSDMTWVVVHDPIPAGAAILGTGLGRDSQLLTRGEKMRGWVWPAFEERTFDSFRAYYEFVPKGRWTLEYTVRLNTVGRFELPETRVEALYAPEMFGEIPNAAIEVKP
jgi:hypothetical protein